MADSVVPSALYAPPALGGGNALGNPVDLIAKVQNLRTQRLEQDLLQSREQSLLQEMTGRQMDRINTVVGALRAGANDEEVNRARLNLEGPGMSQELIDRAFSGIEPAPRAGDPHADEINARRNNVFAQARKFRMTPTELESTSDITTDDQGNVVRVPGVERGMTPVSGMGGGGTPGYGGGYGVGVSPYRAGELKESTDEANKLFAAQTDFEDTDALLHQFRDLSRGIGNDFTALTGPEEQKVRGFMRRFGIDDSKLDKSELYNKIKNQILSKMPTNSVKSLNVGEASLPGSGMGVNAREEGINQLIANNNFGRAVIKEFQNAGGNKSPQSYFDFLRTTQPGGSRAWLTPESFRYSLMSPEAQRDYYKNKTTPQARAALRQNYQSYRSSPYYEGL